MKAYLSFPLKEKAIKTLENANIKVDINKSKEKPQDKDLERIIHEYDIVLISIFHKLTANMLADIKSQKIIATLSVGLDHIEKACFENPLVKIVNIKNANAVSVAEHIFALILALSKRIYESNSLVIKGKGHRNEISDRPNDISNKTLGLIGAGNITREVIRFAAAFRIKMLCYTKNPQNHNDLKDLGVEFVSLDKLLTESDIVNISISLNEETKNFISKNKIALLKSTAIFINTSRTAIVDTPALIKYADKHSTFYVGLDIDINEHKELFMKQRNNVIVTPHLGGISKEAISRMDDELAENIIRLLKE